MLLKLYRIVLKILRAEGKSIYQRRDCDCDDIKRHSVELAARLRRWNQDIKYSRYIYDLRSAAAEAAQKVRSIRSPSSSSSSSSRK